MTAIGGGALFSGAVMYGLLNWLFFEPAWALFFSVLFVALLGLLAVTLPRSGRWKGLIQEVNGRSVCWTAGRQKIAVDDGGIEISSSAGSARTSWDAIDELAMTRTHAFLIFPHLRACVILHEWNFGLEQGAPILWNRRERIPVRRLTAGWGELKVLSEPGHVVFAVRRSANLAGRL